MIAGFTKVLRTYGVTLLCASTVCEGASPAQTPNWTGSFVARIEALALLQTLNADLLSHDSATLTLERWCDVHKLASAPRIKLKGPLAVPALLPKASLLDRRLLTLMPEPEPPLKIIPSSLYQFRIEGIVSSTAKIKQALACCERSGAPILNQTGLLKAAL